MKSIAIAAALLAATVAQPALAEHVNFSFNGTFETASDAYKKGMPFSGKIGFENSVLGDVTDEGTYFYDNSAGLHSVTVGGETFENDGYIFAYDPVVSMLFLSVRAADYSAGVDLFLNRSDPFNVALPTAAELFGKTGKLSFFSFGPNGGGGKGVFTVVAPVPEPATWLTMIAGLGFAAAVARKRRGAGVNETEAA